MEAIVKSRKEANEVKLMARTQYATAEGRRLAVEERRMVVEERKVALEEKKLIMEERIRLLEWEKYLFFIMDTSILDKKQKEYVNLAREEVLVQKRGMRGMRATMGGTGGFKATKGSMGCFGATMRGMGGVGATIGGMGGMSFWSLVGGMGAPPDSMGGRMSSGVPRIPSHDAVEDLTKTFQAPP
ncbi:Tyrosine N-monooxygenase [Hordeum vulgare]|nr:Tyrosine N-monooxygenase [Hordeum vulgare]